MTHRPLEALIFGLIISLSSACSDTGGNLSEPPGSALIELGPNEPTTEQELTLTILEEAPDPNGDLAGYQIQWSVDGTHRPELDSAMTILSSQTQRDETWMVEVIAFDALAKEGQPAIAEVRIQNSPPRVQLSMGDDNPNTITDLTVEVLASDPDNDPVEVTLRWNKNGEHQSDLDGLSTIDSSQTNRGEAWQVTASPSDGSLSGDLASASVQIVNSPPLIVEARLEPEDVTEETVLSVSASASDPDEDPITMSYAWYVNGALIEGQSFSALVPDHFNKGDEVWAEVVPFDGKLAGAAVATTHQTVENTPPTLDSASLSPESGNASTAFSCIPGAWADPDPEDAESNYHYQWRINGASSGSSASLGEGLLEHFDELYCRMRPTDGEENGAWVSSETIIIGNSPPEMSDPTVSLQGGEAEANESSVFLVTTSGFYDADDDPEGYQIQWFVDGLAITGANETTLTGSSFNKGDVVTVSVNPWDGYQTGTQWLSGNWPIQNSPPSANSAELSPAAPTTTDDIVADVLGWTDADGDDEGYAVTWDVSGSDPGESSLTLSSSAFARNDTVSLTLWPDDGEEQGDPISPASVLVVNSPPPTPILSLNPPNPSIGDALICSVDTSATAADADEDSVIYTTLWYEDGIASGDSGGTLAGTATTSGADWTCSVTPDDSFDTGTPGTISTSIDGCAGLSFEAVPGSVTIPADPALQYGSTVTIEAWVRWDGAGDEWQHVYSSGNDGLDSIALGIFGGVDGASCSGRTAGQAYFRVGPNTCWKTTSSLNVGQWHHIAGVYDNGTVLLFLDGSLETSDSTTASPEDASQTGAQIGHQNTNYDFGGVVDEVRLSSIARYASSFDPQEFVQSDADTLGLWHLHSANAGVIRDSSETGLHGSLIGGEVTSQSTCDVADETWAITYACTAISNSGSDYYFCNSLVFPENLTTQCAEIGWLPVTVNDADENAFLVSTACSIDTCPDSTGSDQHHWYIGLSDSESEGVWQWASGESYSYSNFNSAEPNGSTASNYVTLLRYGDGTWNDDSSPKIGFICEAPD